MIAVSRELRVGLHVFHADVHNGKKTNSVQSPDDLDCILYLTTFPSQIKTIKITFLVFFIDRFINSL